MEKEVSLERNVLFEEGSKSVSQTEPVTRRGAAGGAAPR